MAENNIPAEVLQALDRMCTPLHSSWGAVGEGSATAAADAWCMKVIRDYIMGGNVSLAPALNDAQRDDLLAAADYLQFDGSMDEDSAVRRAELLRRIAAAPRRYRHKKRGTTYELVAVAELQVTVPPEVLRALDRMCTPLDVTLMRYELERLAAFLTDDMEKDDEAVRLLIGDGHSGYGLYAAHPEYPEEGAILVKNLLVPNGAQDNAAIVTSGGDNDGVRASQPVFVDGNAVIRPGVLPDGVAPCCPPDEPHAFDCPRGVALPDGGQKK